MTTITEIDINTLTKSLIVSINKNKYDLVNKILSSKVSPDTITYFGNPLIVATKRNNEQIVKLILEFNPKIDILEAKHIAVQNGFNDVARIINDYYENNILTCPIDDPIDDFIDDFIEPIVPIKSEPNKKSLTYPSREAFYKDNIDGPIPPKWFLIPPRVLSLYGKNILTEFPDDDNIYDYSEFDNDKHLLSNEKLIFKKSTLNINYNFRQDVPSEDDFNVIKLMDNFFQTRVQKTTHMVRVYRGIRLNDISELQNLYHSYISVSSCIEQTKSYSFLRGNLLVITLMPGLKGMRLNNLKESCEILLDRDTKLYVRGIIETDHNVKCYDVVAYNPDTFSLNTYFEQETSFKNTIIKD